MSGLLLWVARHSSAAKWLSGGLAAVFLVGGVALGISRSASTQSSLLEGPLQAQPVAARVNAGRHSVVGTVRAVGPAEVLVRSQRGAYFTIRWAAGSQFREAGRVIRPAALRTGDRVVVIGKPAADGSLVASYVTVVSTAPAPTPSVAPGASGSSAQ
jgi:hypothetical protein